MYRAKDSGRNGLAFFSEVDSRPAEERIVMGAGIRRALDTNQLRLLYQPKVSVRTGAMTGVEALVRWEHPERGLLLPDLFIPLAEDSGLIRHIGRWVLHTACAQALAWQADGTGPIRVAVNLSPRQFSDERLVIEIAHALAQTELPAHLLELEITESMMMENPERAAETLREIKEMGVHVSIDDFGTGYSSLARLKKFPIESVKIDRSFIRDIAVDPDDAAIVSAVIAMAHSLRLNVIAEGVETPEQVSFLRERGCDEIQGFYFSRPVLAGRDRGVRRAPRRDAPGSGRRRRLSARRRRPEAAGSVPVAVQVRRGEPQVVEHRPQRQDRGDPQRDRADQRRRNAGDQRLVQQQRDDRRHLRDGLQLADERDGDALALAELRHPFAQRRDRDLAADDDDREIGLRAVEPDQHDQRRRDHQLVGDRIEKGAERRRRAPAAREVAVEPVGDRGDGEDRTSRSSSCAAGDSQASGR